MKRLALLGAIATLSLVAGGVARAQPFTDAAASPGGVFQGMPKARPRSLGLPEWNTVRWTVTPALNVPLLAMEDSQNTEGPLRMGVVQPVGVNSDQGTWVQLPDGGFLWMTAVQATGAGGVRLKFSPWTLPHGAQLIVFNANNPAAESYGPFDRMYQPGEKTFWTPHLFTDRVGVECYFPPNLDPTSPECRIVIESVLNEYRTPLGIVGGNQGGLDELSCHLDVTCYSAWAAASTGVGNLSYTSNQFGFFCSGSMMNRSPTDFTPMFETATHCGVNSGNVSSLLVLWFYQTSTCNNTSTLPALNTLPQTAGYVMLSRDVTNDFTLVGLLFGGDPGGVQYEGWDAGTLADNSSATEIGHPEGAYKRIAFGTKNGNSGSRPDPNGGTSCIGGSAYQVNFAQGSGRIEPGDSGSPIFDSSQRVRGAESCGSNFTCTGTNTGTWGRLDLTWTNVQPYLLPTDPVYVNRAYGGAEFGTSAQPFVSAVHGVYGVIGGHNLYIQSGTYHEPMTIRKPMTIHALNGAVVIGP